MPLSTRVPYARNAARLIRQYRLDRDPFIIGEFVAHDSRLGFGRLNQVLGGTINPLPPVEADSNTLASAFEATADMAAPAAGSNRSRLALNGSRVAWGLGPIRAARIAIIGFEGRFDCAVVGPVANVVSRLCVKAKPKQILISEH
jgi:class 3 adenylate cyclase